MPEDEIVQELRAVRDGYAKRFNYDLRAIFEDLQKKKQARTDGEIVTGTPKRIPPLQDSAKKSA